jgi:hypothetical protein
VVVVVVVVVVGTEVTTGGGKRRIRHGLTFCGQVPERCAGWAGDCVFRLASALE